MSRGIASPDISQLVYQPSRRRSRAAARFRERGCRGLLAASSAFSVFITFTIVVVLLRESIRFFDLDEVRFADFVGSVKWSPLIGGEIGVWPLVSGTLLVTGVAMVVALPLGLVTAIYLSEYASARLRSILK